MYCLSCVYVCNCIKYPSTSLVICGDFNVYLSTGLHSSHISSSGIATLDFCEFRSLCQLVDFPTWLNAILDLVVTEHPGSIEAFPNLNTSDHIVVLFILSSFTNVISPGDHQVYQWFHAPWGRLHHYFGSFHWYSPNSVDTAVFYVTKIVALDTQKFVSSCIPRLSGPIPWYNHHCEIAW